MAKLDQSDTQPGAGSTPQISDPISAAEARALLGVSAGKMTELLKSGTLPWRMSSLDERVKLVSQADVMALLAANRAPSPASDRQSGQRTARVSSGEVYLAEWMAVCAVTAQELHRRSLQVATQHPAPAPQLANRTTLLKAKAVSLPTIRQVARRAQRPLLITVERLAAALGLTPEQLRQPPPPPSGKAEEQGQQGG